MSSPNKPLLLEELNIPGRSKEPVSRDPDIWGINIAAALGNFPLHGLLNLAGPWGNMAPGDELKVYWNTGIEVLSETVDRTEVNTQLRMFVPPRHMVDGQFAVSYSVKPLGGVAESSEVMLVVVKLTRPGGHDDNGDGGHSKLIMIIAQDILDGGIDKDNVADGVEIRIGEADDKPPYPNAAAGDVCRVSWGGIYVLSEPLTQEQAEGKTPITVTIDEKTIRDAGDAEFPGVAVVFEVYDKVFNRSEDWSPEQRVVVAVDATRLGAPLLKETVNNVLDVDKLGDADGTVQIIATDTSNFKIGDIPFIRIKGTPVEGAPIDREVEGTALTSVPSVIEIKAPNAVLRQLAKSQITLSYRLKKADSSADLKSKSQFIRAIGEVQRLAAPDVLDEDSGALDPTLAQIRLKIPFDKSFVEGQVLQPVMLGTTPGLKPYLPELPTRPITRNDIIAAEPLSYNIDGKHLTPVNGGTAEFYYQQLIADAVFATLDPFEASRAIRESIHSDILRVGEARLELPQPEVDGVVDGVLPADTAGTTLTVPYTETVKDDEVFMFWTGSITGEYPDSIKLSEFTAGERVPFPIPAAVIKGNEGGTVVARYEIKRVAGGTSYAEPLEFSVGVALDLKEPGVLQANGAMLEPMAAVSRLTVVVPQGTTLPTDLLSVSWIPEPGTHAEGSFTSDPRPISEIGLSIDIPPAVLAFCLGGKVTVSYTITRGNGQPRPSDPFILNVQELPQAVLLAPRLKEASDAGEGTELNLSELTPEGKMWFSGFPFNAVGQYVWVLFKGTNADGSAYEKYIWAAPFAFVNDDWVKNGHFEATAPYEDLKGLKDGMPLTMEMWVAFGKSEDLGLAKRFSVRTYIVANGKPLVIDHEEMQLNGLNYYISPLSPYQPEWVRTDYKSPRSSEIRRPVDGIPPYIFTSQNTHIATVDAKTGQVYSVSNGVTIIEVRDATGRSGQYPVKCSNVFELFAHYQLLSWGEAHATLRSLNLEPIPFTQTQTQISNPPVDFQFQSRVIGQKTPFFYGTMAINNSALISYLIPTGKSVPPNPTLVSDSGVVIGLTSDANLRLSIIGRRAKTSPAT